MPEKQLLHLVIGGELEDLEHNTFRDLTKIDLVGDSGAYASGKMKKFHIRIIPGDRVKLELSPYDLTRGRITYRDK